MNNDWWIMNSEWMMERTNERKKERMKNEWMNDNDYWWMNDD